MRPTLAALAALGSASPSPAVDGAPPRVPCASCIPNAALTRASPSDPTLPDAWGSLSQSRPPSRFAWVEIDGSSPGGGSHALRIVGGTGRWATRLQPPTGSAGQTLRITFSYRGENATVRARPTYGGCPRMSGLLSLGGVGAQSPGKTTNATQLVYQEILCYGKAVQQGEWITAELGDFQLPEGAAAEQPLWLSIWLADLPLRPGLEPATVWATDFAATLAPPPPPPLGHAALLATGTAPHSAEGWALWSEHANSKLLPSSGAPHGPARPILRLSAASGERAAVQLALRSAGGFWGDWSLGDWRWVTSAGGPGKTVTGAAAPVVNLSHVGYVNLTSANYPYGTAQMTPDPLTPLDVGLAGRQVGPSF